MPVYSCRIQQGKKTRWKKLSKKSHDISSLYMSPFQIDISPGFAPGFPPTFLSLNLGSQIYKDVEFAQKLLPGEVEPWRFPAREKGRIYGGDLWQKMKLKPQGEERGRSLVTSQDGMGSAKFPKMVRFTLQLRVRCSIKAESVQHNSIYIISTLSDSVVVIKRV